MSPTTPCVIPTHRVGDMVDNQCIALSAGHWDAESQGAEHSGPGPSPTPPKNPTPTSHLVTHYSTEPLGSEQLVLLSIATRWHMLAEACKFFFFFFFIKRMAP